MASVAGRLAYFTLNGSNLSSYLDEVSLQRTMNLVETTTYGGTPADPARSREFTEGLRDASLTVSGTYDSTLANVSDVLNTAYTTSLGVAFEFGPKGNGTGDEKFSGTVHVREYGLKQGAGTIVKFTATLQVTGALIRGTFSA